MRLNFANGPHLQCSSQALAITILSISNLLLDMGRGFIDYRVEMYSWTLVITVLELLLPRLKISNQVCIPSSALSLRQGRLATMLYESTAAMP